MPLSRGAVRPPWRGKEAGPLRMFWDCDGVFASFVAIARRGRVVCTVNIAIMAEK